MPELQDLQTSFNAGELSPRLAARLDFAKYRAGLDKCQNLICLPEGGVTRRPGTRYLATAIDSSKRGKLKRFEFNVEQAYMLEFGDLEIRFYRYQSQIFTEEHDAEISNGDFTDNITGWDDVSTGGAGNQISHNATNGYLVITPNGTAADDIGWAEQDVVTSFLGVTHVLKFQVIGAPGDKIEFQVGTATTLADIFAAKEYEVGYHTIEFVPTVSPFYIQFRNRGNVRNKSLSIDNVHFSSNEPVHVHTPWGVDDIPTVDGPQSADVLYLFHRIHPTYKLIRFGHVSWSLVRVNWQDGPYLEENTTTTTLTPSAATGLGITLTLSSVKGVNNNRGWVSTDVGRLVRYKKTTLWGYAVIVSITSTTVAVADVRRDFEATPDAKTTFRLGAWSGTTGYPKVASFFEQRLYPAYTLNQPNTFWFSQTADFENMRPDSVVSGAVEVEDDDAGSYTLSADGVDAIQWISAGKSTIIIGTAGGPWVPTATDGVITPNDIAVHRQTTDKSANILPVRVGNVILFVQKALRKLMELVFSFETDGYVASDMTRLAQHITKDKLEKVVLAEEPDSVVWAYMTSGSLLAMTYRREEDVVGWSRQPIGGTDAVVESIEVIPGADGMGQFQDSTSRDELWLMIKRTINSETVRYVEIMEGQWETGDNQEDAYYSDSLITYDGAATDTVTRLDHIEGEVVKILADGAVHPEKVVVGGSVTLDYEASVIQIGLGYTHYGKTLKISAGNPAGTPVGKRKRTYSLTFVLLNSHTLKYGPSDDKLQSIDFREVEDDAEAVPFFTGEWDVTLTGGWKNDPRVIFTHDDPVPFTLLAIAPNTQINPMV